MRDECRMSFCEFNAWNTDGTGIGRFYAYIEMAEAGIFHAVGFFHFGDYYYVNDTANFKTCHFDQSCIGRSALSLIPRLAGKRFENGSTKLFKN
jgi:hypothetical protein